MEYVSDYWIFAEKKTSDWDFQTNTAISIEIAHYFKIHLLRNNHKCILSDT